MRRATKPTSTEGRTYLRRLAIGLLLIAACFDLAAQNVPAPQQAALFSRILAYDRNLKSRAGSQVTVGIVFKADNGASRAANEEMIAAFAPLKSRTIQDLPFDVASHAYVDGAHLEQWLESRNIDVIYFCPGLETSFAEIAAVAAKRKTVTLSSQRKDVQQGAAVAVIIKDGKPGIIINLTSARALGMDLDPKLLQLAEVLR